MDSIADMAAALPLGGGATFDSGHPGGSIQIRRVTSERFQVVGIDETDLVDSPGEAMAEVGRRRRMRDARSGRSSHCLEEERLLD